MNPKATGCDSISIVFSSIVLLCVNSVIIIVIIIKIIIIIIIIITIIINYFDMRQHSNLYDRLFLDFVF